MKCPECGSNIYSLTTFFLRVLYQQGTICEHCPKCDTMWKVKLE